MKTSRVSTGDFAGLSRTATASLAAAALSVALLAGCGGGSDTSTTSTDGVASNAGSSISTQPTTAAQQDSPLVDTTVYGSAPTTPCRPATPPRPPPSPTTR